MIIATTICGSLLDIQEKSRLVCRAMRLAKRKSESR